MTNSKSVCYVHLDRVDSTNSWAKKNAHTLDPHGLTCITAEEQTAGRGRFERRWVSPRGKNIYASLFFLLPRMSPIVANLGQILSLSCAAMLETKGFSPEIKWPNDLLVAGKKVAGILCESVMLDESLGIILGIGLNVNMSREELNLIDQPATSLAEQSGRFWSCEEILKPLITQFLQDLNLLTKKGFHHFKMRYDELLAFRGERISCQDGAKTLKGILHSITDVGKLNLLLDNGQIMTLSAGEVKPR